MLWNGVLQLNFLATDIPSLVTVGDTEFFVNYYVSSLGAERNFYGVR